MKLSTMASAFSLRRLAVASSTRSFHSTARSFIKVGDKLPQVNALVENSPGNNVPVSELTKGKALIIGVPAAFSKCRAFCFSDTVDQL